MLGRAWFPLLPTPHVGVGPGDEWSQAPTKQEQAQGYKKTDVMTLQIQVGQLRAALDELLANVDASQTDPAALASLQELRSNVVALEAQVSKLTQGYATIGYPALLLMYKAYAADFAGYGIEEAAPPATPSGSGKPAPVPTPKVEQHAATPSSPVITKKAPEDGSWLWYVAAAIAAVGAVLLAAGAKS